MEDQHGISKQSQTYIALYRGYKAFIKHESPTSKF